MASRANPSPVPSRSLPILRGSALGTVLLLLLLPVGLGAKKQKAKIKDLPEQYQLWLEAVELIISKEEKATFLEIEKDYQRDAFIERFWKVRDPYPRTGRNEYRETFEARIAFSLEVFGRFDDDRTRVLLMNGEPLARLVVDCAPSLWPLEVWHYKGSNTYGMESLLLFYQQFGRGPFRLYEPFFGLEGLVSHTASAEGMSNSIGGFYSDCGKDADAVRAAVNFINAQGGQLGAQTFFIRLLAPAEPPPGEWVATFETYSTDLPEDAATFPAALEIDYPGRHQSRTILQGNVAVPVAELGQAELATHASYNLMLNGEILREGALFDSFRYKFDIPRQEAAGDKIPLVFQRYLRPGPPYQLIVKVEDVNSGRLHRSERLLEVPHLEQAPAPTSGDPETARILAEANAAIRSGETTLKITPLQGKWQTGLVRIDALTTGDGIAKVTFLLDRQPILTKKSPPYNVELDLGQVPRSRVLRAEAYDDAGEEIAADEVLLNGGPHRFGVRLLEPRRGKTYRDSLRAQADVRVPEGEVVQRVEFYLNETLVSTLYQPPFIQPIILPEELVAYVRAVAYTPDGHSTEDLVFVNAPDNLEEIDVDFVELFTTVLDRGKHPVEGLTSDDFNIWEDGVEQEMMRFEVVRDLPIHAAIMLDVSASMEEEILQAQTAALHFFEQAVTPKDRAAIVTFNDHPNLAAKFTNDLEVLAGGLAVLKAERGTALYDSLIFTLYYFNGIKGQRAVLLLSDGKDESSRYEFDDALEYAHRAGVAIYSIGLKLPRSQLDARRKLSRIAEETGGRSFFIQEVAELGAIYETIQRELRSRYLLAYQSSNVSGSKRFRTIEVKMGESGLEAKTLRGYYPY